jgi:hypothetical protein
MTGYTVHTGSSQKFTSGWDQIFATRASKAKSVTPVQAKAAAKPAKKITKSK